jgi:hypothetical protein
MVDDDGVRIMRGVLWAMVISLPIWGLIGLGVWLLARS